MRWFALFALAACSDSGVKAFNSPPQATIRAPADGAGVDSEVPFVLSGRVSDPNHDATELTVTWLVGDAAACEGLTPAADGATECEVVFTEDTTITLEAVDPGGASGTATVSVFIEATAVPTAEIVTPTAAGTYYSDQLITFEGVVADGEDAPADLVTVWESSLDGELGIEAGADSDGTVRGGATLTEGQHIVELTVTDTTGKSGSDSVTITVGPPNTAPTCAVTSPVSGAVGQQGEVVLFEGTVADVDVASDWLSVSWESDKDGPLGDSTPTTAGAVTFPFSDLTVDTHVVSMTVTDEVGATCTDQVVYTVGSPPTVTIDGPTDGQRFNEGDAVDLAATVSDSEDLATALVVDWATDLAGGLGSTTPDASGATGLSVSDFAVGTHALTVTVTDTDGLAASASLDFVVNGLPTAPVVSIDPDPASTGDDLTAQIDTGSTDPEGDPVTYTYAWYQDGSLTTHAGATVPSADTARGETWRVVVTPNDGSGDGAPGEAEITVGNTAPVVSSVTLSPSPAYTDDTVTASVVSSDVDGDSVSFAYAWTVGGVASAETGSSLDGATAFSKGDTVVVTVTPTDGTDTGSPVASASLTIANTPPEAPAVSIDPSAPDENDDLICLVDADSPDADEDAITYTMSWTVDGTAFTGATTTTWTGDTIDAADTAIGDVWVCTATPNDGDDDGTTASATVTVESAYDGWSSSDVSLSSADHVLLADSSDDRASGFLNGAGDADADGLSDVVMNAYRDSVGGTSAGASYYISGATLAANPGTSVASSIADVVLLGESAGDQAGAEAAWLGDLDGDGLDDLAVTAGVADVNGTDSGAVYIVTGATLATLATSSTLADSDWRVHGESAGDKLIDAHPAGDIDGDGDDDFLMGARFDDAGGTDAGAGYLMYSGTLPASRSISVGSSDVKFVGEQAGDTAGGFVRGGGDVDGDGTNDVAVNAWYADRVGTRSGRGYVILSGTFAGGGSIDLSNSDYIFDGEASNNYAGHRISLDGDMDGDGQAEVVLSAYFNDDAGTFAGKTYLFEGASLTAGSTGTRAITSADHIWTGAAAGDQLGTGLGFAGDIDADGKDDLLVKAKLNDAGATDAGTIYLLLADSLGSGGTSSITGAYDFAFQGITASAQCGLWGTNARAPGDVDGDGLDDIMVSCPYSSVPGSQGGAVYLFLTP